MIVKLEKFRFCKFTKTEKPEFNNFTLAFQTYKNKTVNWTCFYHFSKNRKLADLLFLTLNPDLDTLPLNQFLRLPKKQQINSTYFSGFPILAKIDEKQRIKKFYNLNNPDLLVE